MSSAEALDLIRRVAEALTSAGLVVDGEPDCSGELVRCGTTQKPHGTDGAYKVHLDVPPSVWLCNYAGRPLMRRNGFSSLSLMPEKKTSI